MITLQRRLVRLVAAAVAVVGWGGVIVAPTGASAAIVTTPTDLSLGDQYRLAFVTSTTRDATSSEIAVYNAFVTTAANSQMDLADLGATWTVIGSTPTVDARDNTGTKPTLFGGTVGVPIYLLDGITEIADNNADLWDGSAVEFSGIDNYFNIFEDGLPIGSQTIWTGTASTGIALPGFALGSPEMVGVESSATGRTMETNDDWVEATNDDSNTHRRFFAISSQLTVAAVPLPGALILFGSGLACLAVLRRRNRSVRPA